jgi:uncharacterized protein (DUF362 family)
MNRVYIARLLEDGIIGEEDILNALKWLGWEKTIMAGTRIFIKPNLTWPVHLPGVTTTPQAIEALVAVLKKRTNLITVGESDGGYHAYKAEETFNGHGLYTLAEKYGIQVFNLSKDRTEPVTSTIAGRPVTVILPWRLLHETDLFITMPVPKTHVMTGVSLAFKNQWGCLPSTMRLMEHYEFDRKIVAINKLVNTRLTIMDGTYFLDGAGPMTGEVIQKNMIIASNQPGPASAVACAIMGIDPRSIRHKRIAMQEKMFPLSLDEIKLNTSIDPFKDRQFKMRRGTLDWISLMGFRSKFLSKLFYDSSTARLLHSVLFTVRRNKWINRFLYGKAGSPPDPTKPMA